LLKGVAGAGAGMFFSPMTGMAGMLGGALVSAPLANHYRKKQDSNKYKAFEGASDAYSQATNDLDAYEINNYAE
jgi:hypothetical protein